MSHRYLQLTVFAAGMAALGVELAASRLLAPFFGTSLLVWANLIGVILIYLSVGYWLGGRWADRSPSLGTLFLILAVSGLAIGLVPYIAAPLLSLAIPALAQFNAELGLVSFLGVVVLFAVPITLLGCVPPFALRLSAQRIETIGATGGGLYALSTIGSIVGIYLTVFWLIPTFGTRFAFLCFALVLLAIASVGLWRSRKLRYAAGALVLLVFLVIAGFATNTRPIKPLPGAIFEAESPYNFIQVIEENGLRLLTVNEGQAYQSVYYPGAVRLGGYWDLFLLTPYASTPEPPRSLLVVGLAAGTVTKQFARVYPEIQMEGIELDPEIVRIGRDLFDMHEPQLKVVVDDGRAALRKTGAKYDVIIVDAYRQPYIPFHLATVEYYRELADHLTPRGIVAINAARTPDDSRLVNSLAATLKQVYPTVWLMDYPNDSNTIIVASPQPIAIEAFRNRLTALQDPILHEIAEIAIPNVREFEGDGLVFTDDKSSVENLIHSIIFDATLASPGGQ